VKSVESAVPISESGLKGANRGGFSQDQMSVTNIVNEKANLQRAQRRGETRRLQNQTQYNVDRWPAGSEDDVTPPIGYGLDSD